MLNDRHRASNQPMNARLLSIKHQRPHLDQLSLRRQRSLVHIPVRALDECIVSLLDIKPSFDMYYWVVSGIEHCLHVRQVWASITSTFFGLCCTRWTQTCGTYASKSPFGPRSDVRIRPSDHVHAHASAFESCRQIARDTGPLSPSKDEIKIFKRRGKGCSEPSSHIQVSESGRRVG